MCRLPNLRCLTALKDCSLFGLELVEADSLQGLSCLTWLETLTLRHCSLHTSSLISLTNLASLQSLTVASNGYCNLEPIASLNCLQSLDVRGCGLPGLPLC